MVKKFHFIPLFAIPIIGLILGSFFDFQINSALFDRYNGFGIFMAAFGELPVYAFTGVLAYGFIYLCKTYDKIWQRILLYILALASVGVGLYYQGEHIVSVNAYNNKSLLWLGLLIAAVIIGLGALAGHFLFKNTDQSPKNILFILISIVVVIGFAVLVTQVVKAIMSRPRFRFIIDYTDDAKFYFCNWWQSGKSTKEAFVNKEMLDGVIITKEEFVSFPSGHISNTASFIAIAAYLPLLNSKIRIKQEILFYIAFAWVILLAYTRMRVGAHFLSDVSMGLLINAVGFFVVDFILTRKTNLVPNKEIAAE